MSEVAELIRGAYEAFSRGEFDAVVDLLHPEVEWVPPPSSLDPRPLRGRDAVREYLAPNFFESQSAEPLEIIEDGNSVLVVAHVRARGRGSGIEVDQVVFHLFVIEDGRAVRFSSYVDRAEALAALRTPSGR